jgi:hypothetical protein
MTDWARLRHAYGSAEDVPALLAEAEAVSGDDASVWDDLWGRLCHQGSVYTASYAALPALAAMAAQRAPAGYVVPLHLAAAIIASNDGADEATAVRRRYEDELGVLREVAERNLAHADGDVEFVYGLQALMAFEDRGVWQRHLESLADGELSLECPSCGDDLLMPLDGPEFHVASFADASVSSTPVIPIDLADTDDAARMLRLARAHGRGDVAAKLPYLLGRATCPSCGAAFDVATALAWGGQVK